MFNTYAEAQNWIEAGQSKYGKRAFTSRPEYAEAYAEMTAFFHAENPNYKKPNRKNATPQAPGWGTPTGDKTMTLTKNTEILRAEVAAHIAADALVRESYWKPSENAVGGQGCFIS